MVKIFELGPCQVYFNDKYIGHTLKTDSTSLKLQAITQEIKTDESSEIKEILELGRNITFETTVLLDENNKYKMLMKIYINGVLVIPGTPKDFTVKVKIYKDYSCEKYIGYINVNVTMIKTTGPGE